MSQVTDDLKAAFAGESQANRKYLAFAKKAEQDGFPQVAKLFRAAAAAETVHALNHFKALGEIKSTAENLQAAIQGENYEVVSMYPAMIQNAEAEGNNQAVRTLRWAYEVEKIHEALYRQALSNLDKTLPEVDYYICPFCGYTHEGPMTDKCPVCGASPDKFEKVA